VRNAVGLARSRGFRSVALPLIGAGTGGRSTEQTQRIIEEELRVIDFDGEIRIVRYRAR
jgi:O-acetyl-ADP-ribose deacetylase (regulator of RNase III)